MKRFLVVILLIVALGGAAGWWYLRPSGTAFLTDASTIREAATTAVVREVLWQPPNLVTEGVNGEGDTFEPRMSADGQTMYFVRGRPGGRADVYSSSLVDGKWGEPTPVEAINSEFDELGPELSADGARLYFYSDRPGGAGGYDIWVSKRADGDWQTPESLGTAVNSPFNEYGPALSRDGMQLCFSSNRPRGDEASPSDDAWRATVREDIYRHDYDLYVVAFGAGAASKAARLDSLCSPGNDGSPTFSPAGDFLYFSSDRFGGQGGFDLYRSRIVRGHFETPTNLGNAVNTAANELDPSADLGGFALHFSSDRAIDEQAARGVYRIYRTSSREVFRDVEWRQASIDWRALWLQIGPRVGWIVLGVLLFLLLLALFRDAQRRKLNLLARCLIVSLLAHAVMMMVFNVVEVSTAVASYVRGRGGPVRVSTLAGGKGVSLAGQIRGQITETPTLAIPTMSVRKAESRVPFTAEATPVKLAMEPAAKQAFVPVVENTIVAESTPRSALVAPTGILEMSRPTTSIQLPGEVQRRSESENALVVGGEATHGLPVRAAAALPREIAEGSLAMLSPDARGRGSELTQISVIERLSPTESDAPAGLTSARGIGQVAFAPTDVASGIGLPSDGEVSRASGSEVGIATSAPSGEVKRPHRGEASIAGLIDRVRSDVIATEKSDGPGTGFGSAVVGVGGVVTESTGAPPISQPPLVMHSVTAESATGLRLPVEGAGVRDATAERGAMDGIPIGNAAPVAHANSAATQGAIDALTSQSPVMIAPAGGRAPGPSVVSAKQVGGPNVSPSSPVGIPSVSVVLSATPDAAVALPVEIEAPVEADIVPSPPSVFGWLEGRVIDGETGRSLADAMIRIDVSGQAALEVVSDWSGRYKVELPALPDNFAVSASKSGYLPRSRNVEASSVRGRTRKVNFRLQRETEKMLALEDSPEVHHLGNDAFEGAINSQFQRESEGVAFVTTFDLSAEQLAGMVQSAELELMAKGVQCPHKIRINGRLLDTRLDQSPPDGSFGVFTTPLTTDLLRAGENTLEIRAVSCRGDLDDFEFINIQLKLFANPH